MKNELSNTFNKMEQFEAGNLHPSIPTRTRTLDKSRLKLKSMLEWRRITLRKYLRYQGVLNAKIKTGRRNRVADQPDPERTGDANVDQAVLGEVFSLQNVQYVTWSHVNSTCIFFIMTVQSVYWCYFIVTIVPSKVYRAFLICLVNLSMHETSWEPWWHVKSTYIALIPCRIKLHMVSTSFEQESHVNSTCIHWLWLFNLPIDVISMPQ